MDKMESLRSTSTVGILLVISCAACEAALSPHSRLTGRETGKEAINCREAGWTSCCNQGNCLAHGGQCFCDISCHEFGDCCRDIDSICPKAVCTDGRIRITKGQFKLCTNGTFKNMCDLPEETVTMLEHEGILKRQTGGVGSGGGTGILVEVGFTESAYTTSESDGSVMVCVEVKSGQLAPAELAPLTLTTSPGTALAEVDYVSVTDNVEFDGNTLSDPFCIAILIIDDAIFEAEEYFSVSLSCLSPIVTLDDASFSASVSITTTDLASPGDSCADVGLSGKCCVGPAEQCQSHNSTCFCDNSCFERTDCCEDIYAYAVEMQVRDVYVDEGNSVPVCTVLIGRFDDTSEDIVVNMNFIGSGLPGEDYRANSTEIVFPAKELQQLRPGGSLVHCINIDATNDRHVEGEQTFMVEIVSSSPSSVVSCSSSSSTTVHIQDDDVAEVSLVPLPTAVPEETPLNVCVRLSGVDYTSIPLSVNITISSEQSIISNSQVVFAVGELANGGVECYRALLDDNVLEWTWQLTVALEVSDYNQPIILTTPDTLHLSVTDDEVRSVSVHFESAGVQVTKGQRTVLCVVLEGAPGGGMTQDLSVFPQLLNGTAELGTDFALGDASSSTTDSPALVFPRGSRVVSRQCLLVDTSEVFGSCEELHFNMTISHTSPLVDLQEPLTASVFIRVTNTICLCPLPPTIECPQTTERDSRESLYLSLLLAMAALVAVCLLILVALLAVLCCYCHHHNHYYNKDTAIAISDGSGTTIHNLQATEDHTDNDRTKTLTSLGSATYDSFKAHKNSAEKAAVQARNRAVRSIILAHNSDVDEPDDYLQLHPAAPAVVRSSSPTHDYEEPVPSAKSFKPSSTLL